MKINEILTEGGTGSLLSGIAHALPDVNVLTDLKNTDPYLQYRMGIALAAARAHDEDQIDFAETSAWGENMAVVSYTEEDQRTLDLALKLMPGVNAAKQISTRKSEEATDVQKTSPMPARGPIRKLK